MSAGAVALSSRSFLSSGAGIFFDSPRSFARLCAPLEIRADGIGVEKPTPKLLTPLAEGNPGDLTSGKERIASGARQAEERLCRIYGDELGPRDADSRCAQQSRLKSYLR